MSIVRTLFFAKRVEGRPAPYDALQVSVMYPARLTGSERERQHGIVDAEAEGAPYPVVIFLNGVNCDPSRYQWLLLSLVSNGVVCATVDWVAETMPGIVALTPGVDLQYVTQETYGDGPTAAAVAPVLEVLADANSGDGPLGGMLDLDRIALGGHSGGGTVALHSARQRYFPAMRAVFSYGAHTVPAKMLGFESAEPLSVSSDVPALILGGCEDGVIVSSSHRYGEELEPATLLRRTFERGFAEDHGHRYFAMFRGANHFTVVHPLDPTAGRAFLDRKPIGDEGVLRLLITRVVNLFLDAHLRAVDGAAEALVGALDDPLIESFAQR